MIQRVVRQISESGINGDITVATSISQRDSVVTQLGDKINLVTEPSRRRTFPAICLACEYLSKVKKCSDDEVVIVMPCDPFTGPGYFECITRMANGVSKDLFPLILLGITPTYPSSKYGYIIPSEISNNSDASKFGPEIRKVSRFIEKPDVKTAENLISQGGLWNAGVFAFKLGFATSLSDKYLIKDSFTGYLDNYEKYPVISFDNEVAEKARSMGMVAYEGYWKDLGTWNTLTDELPDKSYGNVITDNECYNTHIFNELNIPLLCLGTKDLVIAASPDGILVSEKSKSENIKTYAAQLKNRPMFEERRWGSYKVIDYVDFPDHFHALTKQLTLNPGGSISYQSHECRDEVWTFIDGEGEIVIEDVVSPVKRGDVINIPKGTKHALRAITPLTFIEVQHGSKLIEEDIRRYPFIWKS